MGAGYAAGDFQAAVFLNDKNVVTGRYAHSVTSTATVRCCHAMCFLAAVVGLWVVVGVPARGCLHAYVHEWGLGVIVIQVAPAAAAATASFPSSLHHGMLRPAAT